MEEIPEEWNLYYPMKLDLDYARSSWDDYEFDIDEGKAGRQDWVPRTRCGLRPPGLGHQVEFIGFWARGHPGCQPVVLLGMTRTAPALRWAGRQAVSSAGALRAGDPAGNGEPEGA